MSLFVDLKYLKLISNKLPLFKQKNNNLYNCRCVICGDSQTKKTKTRGYFYAVKNDLFYKCHNCDASMHFGSFLKQIDQLQYNQYSLERYNEGLPLNKPHQKVEPNFKMAEPVFEKKNILDELLDRLDKLPEDNEAVQFCLKRKIPKEQFNKLYFIDDIRKIGQLSDKYKDKLVTSEPRLVLPFYDDKGMLTGVTCRALRNESLRYLAIKISEDKPFIFGLDSVDTKRKVYVVEGPIDSLFVPNCIAVGGTSFGKLDTIGIPKDNLVVVFDNQPRNKEVVKLIDKTIDNNYNVVIWPQTLAEKDINDMVLSGKDPVKILTKNIYSGLEAKVKFVAWKRC
jgi:DNA primase